MDKDKESVRLDKWLWAARFFKTRSLAQDAVERGRVRIDGEAVKPARTVKINDKMTIDNGSDRWEIIVAAISGARGGAPVARTLYFETDESIAKRENDKVARRLYPEPSLDIKGRPTKQDRRALSRATEE
ncbi:RNA-binding S4 domain-containing protein [Massilia aurea]|uniref:RNA-binding S4 domain-containing protein n=1 Tax=Massilia aurea TaxID=373040 RepID=UPI0034620050